MVSIVSLLDMLLRQVQGSSGGDRTLKTGACIMVSCSAKAFKPISNYTTGEFDLMAIASHLPICCDKFPRNGAVAPAVVELAVQRML